MKYITIIVVSVLFISLIAGGFYWVQIRPSQLKAKCYTDAYDPYNRIKNPRPHERDYKWAQGKQWLPKPDSQWADTSEYVWIYPDQDTMRMGEEVRADIAAIQDFSHKDCLRRNGL